MSWSKLQVWLNVSLSQKSLLSSRSRRESLLKCWNDVGIVSLISSNMLCTSVRVVAAVLFISLTIAPLVQLLNLLWWFDLSHFFHFATMSITVLKGRAKTIAITFSSCFCPNIFIWKFHKLLVFFVRSRTICFSEWQTNWCLLCCSWQQLNMDWMIKGDRCT